VSSPRMFVRQRTNPRGVRVAIDDQLRRFAIQGNGGGCAASGPGLPRDWVPVLELHPDGVESLPGYVWLDMPGKVRALPSQAKRDFVTLRGQAQRGGWS
jgi:hypothetical protein